MEIVVLIVKGLGTFLAAYLGYCVFLYLTNREECKSLPQARQKTPKGTMRKLVIVALTTATVFLAVLLIASYWWWPAYWTKRLDPNIEVSCLPGQWTVNFAPESPMDLLNLIILKGGKLSYYRRVAIDDVANPPTEFTSNYELFGYCLSHGVKPRRLGPQPLSMTSILIIKIPILPMLLIVAGYPLIAFVRGPLRRHRRKRRNLCLNCAYNLTGNVTNICPECGSAVD